jgi:hypothetical protein
VETQGRKDEDVVELNNDERFVSMKKKLIGESQRRGLGPPPRPKDEEHPPSPWRTI